MANTHTHTYIYIYIYIHIYIKLGQGPHSFQFLICPCMWATSGYTYYQTVSIYICAYYLYTHKIVLFLHRLASAPYIVVCLLIVGPGFVRGLWDLKQWAKISQWLWACPVVWKRARSYYTLINGVINILTLFIPCIQTAINATCAAFLLIPFISFTLRPPNFKTDKSILMWITNYDSGIMCFAVKRHDICL